MRKGSGREGKRGQSNRAEKPGVLHQLQVVGRTVICDESEHDFVL